MNKEQYKKLVEDTHISFINDNFDYMKQRCIEALSDPDRLDEMCERLGVEPKELILWLDDQSIIDKHNNRPTGGIKSK